MSTASQVSDLAAAIGAKIKVSLPVTRHKTSPFGIIPVASSAAVAAVPSNVFYGTNQYVSDGDTFVPSYAAYALSGHWSGTYTLKLMMGMNSNCGIVKIEWSKDGGTTWTTLNAAFDSYSATFATGVLIYTGLSIPEGSDLMVRFTGTGKNASATAYYVAYFGWELLRTGA